MTDTSSTPENQEPLSHSFRGALFGLLAFIVVILLPTPTGMDPAAQRLIGLIALMGVFWFTEVIPTGATSLIPIAAFPLLGIMPAKEVSKLYMDQNILLFLGGFIIALGIEKWNLHRRMALHVVRRLGDSPRRLILGFMLGTAAMSMWISNTASTLLMLPLGTALLTSLADQGMSRDQLRKLSPILVLSIAYAASLGGSTTLVGTPTNLVFQSVWSEKFPEAPEFTAGQWMILCVPIGTVMLLCTWFLLIRSLPKSRNQTARGKEFFTAKLRELGKPSQAEWVMLGLFSTTALLWVFRKPIHFTTEWTLPGWEPVLMSLLPYFEGQEKFLHDSTVAIGICILMFLIPVKGNGQHKPSPLMDWETLKGIPWSILFLIGGGFAIASATQATGLSPWIGEKLGETMAGWPAWGYVLAVCLLMTFLTEFTSNVATASALMPILADTALELNADPRLLMLPAILSTSCAFMLPIATPPNAIVYGSGKITMSQMAKRGLVLNLVGSILITLMTLIYIQPLLAMMGE